MALSKKTLTIIGSLVLLIVVVSVVVVVLSAKSSSQSSALVTRVPTTMAPTKFASIQNGQNFLLQNQIMEAPYLGVFNDKSAYLSSPQSQYRFYLQTDGNLMIYRTNVNPWVPIWRSNSDTTFVTGTFPRDGSVMLRLILNSVGDLILYYYIVPTSDLVPVWSTNTANKGGTRLIMQDDSNLVIYRNENNTSPVWSTITGML